MVLTSEHNNLLAAARKKYGHIKKCDKLKDLSEGFQDSSMGLIFWFNDGNNSTHIVSKKEFCPECDGILEFPDSTSHGHCNNCHKE